MAQVTTKPQVRVSPPRRRWRRWGVALFLTLIIVLILAGIVEQLPQPAPHVVVAPQSSPAFQPQVGDVGDNDDGVNVTMGTIPGFQYKSGGDTLNGVIADAHTGQQVGGASIWITLPPALGQRTAPVLRAVSTIDGTFSFAHLAAGSYNLAIARYFMQPGQPMYPEATFQHVVVPARTTLRFALPPNPAPGLRHPGTNVARNVIMLDTSGIYADSWFDDSALQSEDPNIRAMATMGARASHVVAPYGWHPVDQYALFSGTYPAWRVYDSWPQLPPWGTPDGIDTAFWYNTTLTKLEFGQESLFDVARNYGMSTAVLGGQKYLLNDVSTRGVQTAQIGLTFDSANWLVATQHIITTMRDNPNGFVFYGELDPPFGAAGAAGASPDAAGGSYARAMQADDQLVGTLRNWLADQKLLDNTVLIVTASEAQVNETVFDNYYGMGLSGRGSSLDVPLILSGKGVASSMLEQQPISSFAVAATALRALCLPAPANARATAIITLYRNQCP